MFSSSSFRVSCFTLRYLSKFTKIICFPVAFQIFIVLFISPVTTPLSRLPSLPLPLLSSLLSFPHFFHHSTCIQLPSSLEFLLFSSPVCPLASRVTSSSILISKNLELGYTRKKYINHIFFLGLGYFTQFNTS